MPPQNLDPPLVPETAKNKTKHTKDKTIATATKTCPNLGPYSKNKDKLSKSSPLNTPLCISLAKLYHMLVLSLLLGVLAQVL